MVSELQLRPFEEVYNAEREDAEKLSKLRKVLFLSNVN